MPWKRVETSDGDLSYSMNDMSVQCTCGHVIEGDDLEGWAGPNLDTFVCPQCGRRYEIRLDLYLSSESESTGYLV